MDSELIDRLSEPDFAVRLWGYDRQEVDALLADLRKRAEAGQLPPTEAEAIESQLSGIGERVESILSAARATAEHVSEEATSKAAALSRESEQAAEHARREADSYARTTKTDADQHASRVRSEADREADATREKARTEAEATVAAAEEEADQILRDAQLERGRIEQEIEGLRERRELVIQSIERMRGSLGSMVGEAAQGTAAFVAMGDEHESGAVVFDEAEASDGAEPDAGAEAPADEATVGYTEDELIEAEDLGQAEDLDEAEEAGSSGGTSNGVPVFDIGELSETDEDGYSISAPPPLHNFGEERTEVLGIEDAGDDVDTGEETTETFERGTEPDTETAEQDPPGAGPSRG